MAKKLITPNLQWKKSLEKCPRWVLEALELLGPKFDYIAYRLSEGAEDFLLNATVELERILQGTKDINSDQSFSSHEQRVAFFITAIQFADYFRPASDSTLQRIPAQQQPNNRNSALSDLEIQKQCRSEIERLSKDLASLLRQHHQVTHRLGVLDIECDPLELIERACAEANNTYLSGIQSEFDSLVNIKMNTSNQTLVLAQIMDELSNVSRTPDTLIIPPEFQLGITSRKSDHHFYFAFCNWLSENTEEYGGFIPNRFHLTDRCWATLISSLTYRDVDEKSVQMLRKRAEQHQQKVRGKTPQFDFDKLFESWGK